MNGAAATGDQIHDGGSPVCHVYTPLYICDAGNDCCVNELVRCQHQETPGLDGRRLTSLATEVLPGFRRFYLFCFNYVACFADDYSRSTS